MAIGQWLCGGCGQIHGWACPYFGDPGHSARMTTKEHEKIMRQVKTDYKNGKLKPPTRPENG